VIDVSEMKVGNDPLASKHRDRRRRANQLEAVTELRQGRLRGAGPAPKEPSARRRHLGGGSDC